MLESWFRDGLGMYRQCVYGVMDGCVCWILVSNVVTMVVFSLLECFGLLKDPGLHPWVDEASSPCFTPKPSVTDIIHVMEMCTFGTEGFGVSG